MNGLYAGRFAPITDTFGFLRCPPDRAADAFLAWQQGIQSKRGVSLHAAVIDGDLPSSMAKLLPLTSVERRRFLFIPTQSEWTAFLDNGHEGTDAFSQVSYLSRQIGCDAVRATWVPEEQASRYPATILEIYAPHQTGFLNIKRSVSAAFDGAKWSFSADGEVQPFEEVGRYTERAIKKRFDGALLDHYLRALGIAAFDEDFFAPAGSKTIFIEKAGPIAPAAREFALQHA